MIEQKECYIDKRVPCFVITLSKNYGKSRLAIRRKLCIGRYQSVDCHATVLFTISLSSAKVWNRGFNWPVFGVGMHKKSPNASTLFEK